MNFQTTLDCLVNYPTHISIMLIANHGLGKSDCVKQSSVIRAERLNAPCPTIDIRLSQKEVGDMVGMPFLKSARTYFAPPTWFPMRKEDEQILKELFEITEQISLGTHGEYGTLFLDELNRANREVQQAAFELVLDRRLNERKLPDGWRVVSAINGSESYTTTALDPALISRFAWIPFQPTKEEWLKWSRTDGKVHPAVIQFIERWPDFLDPTDEEISNNMGSKLHDRRSWDRLSQTITTYEQAAEVGYRKDSILANSQSDLLYQITKSFVGENAAGQFQSFILTDYKQLDADTILNKWTPDIEKRVKEIASDGTRVTEIAAYNEQLVEFVKSKVKKTLSDKQSENLLGYIRCLEKEMVADFWKHFNGECTEVANTWYNHPKFSETKKNDGISDIILSSLAKPKV